jgi:DNA-binding NarL/FixJ family response regulator
MNRIKILLADDHAVVREGIRKLLETDPDLKIVAEAENGREAVALAAKTSPDIVIMDLAMPVMNGLSATRLIAQRQKEVKIIVLTSYDSDINIKELREAGASGYLLKQGDAAELLRAVREVHKGGNVFSASIVKRLHRREVGHADTNGHTGVANSLTPRQMEVLQLISEGFKNLEMATELDISVKTVEKHRQCVMDKLNLHHAASLTLYAINERLVTLDAIRAPRTNIALPLGPLCTGIKKPRFRTNFLSPSIQSPTP